MECLITCDDYPNCACGEDPFAPEVDEEFLDPEEFDYWYYEEE